MPMEKNKGVSARHPEYEAYSGRWELTKSVVRSDVIGYIKDVEESFDIDSNVPEGLNDEQLARFYRYWGGQNKKVACRNNRYKEDANFINFTGAHKNFLLGALFRNPMIAQLPSEIDYLIQDATGAGQSLSRLMQEVAGEVIQTGRYGLLVDYPENGEGLTRQEAEERQLRANICKYPAESIINWQTDTIYGVEKLTLVVLKEMISSIGDDGFTWEARNQYRVLRLDDDGYYMQAIYEIDDKGNDVVTIDYFYPTDNDGNRWQEIPFVFIGSENNDPKVDSIPLYDIARTNISHLQNSADYEESIRICGNPTMVIRSNMDATEFERANPGGIQTGARRGINLGPDSDAKFIQPEPNGIVREGMRDKEMQIQMMGVRPFIPGGANETVLAVKLRLTGETCEMNIWAQNLSDGAYKACYWALKFDGDINKADQIKIKMNDDFIGISLDPAQLQGLQGLVSSGAISLKDLRAILRESGEIKSDRTDDDIERDILREQSFVDPMSGSTLFNRPTPQEMPADDEMGA